MAVQQFRHRWLDEYDSVHFECPTGQCWQLFGCGFEFGWVDYERDRGAYRLGRAEHLGSAAKRYEPIGHDCFVQRQREWQSTAGLPVALQRITFDRPADQHSHLEQCSTQSSRQLFGCGDKCSRVGDEFGCDTDGVGVSFDQLAAPKHHKHCRDNRGVRFGGCRYAWTWLSMVLQRLATARFG